MLTLSVCLGVSLCTRSLFAVCISIISICPYCTFLAPRTKSSKAHSTPAAENTSRADGNVVCNTKSVLHTCAAVFPQQGTLTSMTENQNEEINREVYTVLVLQQVLMWNHSTSADPCWILHFLSSCTESHFFDLLGAVKHPVNTKLMKFVCLPFFYSWTQGWSEWSHWDKVSEFVAC